MNIMICERRGWSFQVVKIVLLGFRRHSLV